MKTNLVLFCLFFIGISFTAVRLTKHANAADKPVPNYHFGHPVSAVFCPQIGTSDCFVCKPEPDGTTSCWRFDP